VKSVFIALKVIIYLQNMSIITQLLNDGAYFLPICICTSKAQQHIIHSSDNLLYQSKTFITRRCIAT